MVTVSTLGTGTAFPEAERGPTCFVVSNDDARVVVDVGSGSLQKLARFGVTPLDMDALLLTHAHLDHFADVVPLLFALAVPGYTRPAPLPIYASVPTFALLDRLADAYGHWLDTPQGAIRRVPLRVGQYVEVGGLGLEVHAVSHSESSIGFRFVDGSGAVIAIPGDTGPTSSLDALCKDADLALIECAMPDSTPLKTHMNPSVLAQLVNSAGIKRLAVTHRYPTAIAEDVIGTLRSLVSIPVVVPDDGDTLHVDGS